MKKIDLLIKAKALYKELLPDTMGMCYCLRRIVYDQVEVSCHLDYVDHSMLLYNFPEFNPEYFKSTASIYEFWWDIEDIESRLKAFDTLIKLYKNNTEEFTYMTGKIKYSITFYMFTGSEYIICTRSYKSTLKYAFKYMWRRKKIGVFKIKRLK